MAKKTMPRRQLIRLDVDEKLHQEVRMAAARRQVSMAEFARQSVSDAAKKVNKDGDK